MSTGIEVKNYKLKALPLKPIPNAILYIKGDTDINVTAYITDVNGVPYPLKDDASISVGVQTVFNTDGTISVIGSENVKISLPSSILTLISSSLQPGDNISNLLNDEGYLKIVDLPNTKSEFNSQLSDGDFLFVGDVVNYTDEQAQDAVGGIFVDTSTIDIDYNDSTPEIAITVKPNSITSVELANNINLTEFVNNASFETTSQLNTRDTNNRNRVNHTGAQAISTVTNLQTSLDSKENKSEKNVANGYAPLDSNSKVPLANINDSLLGNVKWYGHYNGAVISDSPTPILNGTALPAPSSTNVGWYFIANSTFTNSGDDYVTGDWIISNGIVWGKVDNTDAVSSVAGMVGVVSISNLRIALSINNTDNTSDINKPVSTAQQIAIDAKVADIITDSVTTIAPSQNIVFDALQKKIALPTGFIEGLALSINVDTTKFNIASGFYTITDFSDLINPTVTIKTFIGLTAITPTYLATANATYIALDINGNVIQSVSPFSSVDRRNLAILGAVIHSNNTNINTTNEIKAPITAPVNQLHDFMKAVGFLNEEGNVYSANGANLQLNKSIGKIFGMGINATNYLNPHELSIPAQTALTFAYRLRGGTQFANTTSIDPNNWDNNGVLTSTGGGNKWQIQHINLFQSGLTRIQYGQTIYTSFNNAITALPTDPFITEQNIADNAVFRSYLIIKQGVTNLTTAIAAGDALFVPVDKFGNVIGNGAVALTFSSIVGALGYTPADDSNVIHKTLNETKTGTLSLITPNIAAGTSGLNAITPIVVTGGKGGDNTNTSGTVIAGNAANIFLQAGLGGSSTSSGTAIGGKGGDFKIMGGDGGFALGAGTLIPGNGGVATVQAGSSYGGQPGFADVKAGNNNTVGGLGGNVFLTAGWGNNNALSNPLYDGTIFLGVSGSNTVRGNTVIGNTIDDRINRLQVTGSGVFTGVVKAAPAVLGTELVTLNQLNSSVATAISNTVTSASTLTLTASPALVNYYVFIGSTATWTLPPPASNATKKLALYNTGTGIVTINSDSGANVIYNGGTPLVNTYASMPGLNIELYSDGTRWIVI